MKKQRSAIQRRVNLLAMGMMALMGFIVLRYGWLQLVEGNELSERMKNQVGHDFAIQSPRGTILDRKIMADLILHPF